MQINTVKPDYTQPWANDDDKWFKENPGRLYRARKPFPDEFKTLGIINPPTSCQMLVKQLEPGEYAMLVYNSDAPIPDDEHFIQAICHTLLEPTAHKSTLDFFQTLINKMKEAEDHAFQTKH